MERDELVLACTSDIAGKLRGKAFPAVQMDKRLRRGIGWTPTNVQITCFDTIADSPFGSLGDLVLVPDADAALRITDGESPTAITMLGDIRHTDGRAWECCTRSILRAALDRLERVSGGLSLRGAFEHEFQICDHPLRPGTAFSASDFLAWRPFAESVVAAMRVNDLEPDTILREFGPAQFEVTMNPAAGVAIADRAVLVREVVHAVAARFAQRASFAPIRDPAGVGNGVHVHLGLVDTHGRAATHDAAGRHELSPAAAQFVAGILTHLPSLTAITAPSAVSYLRLVPHRWSAAFNNLGYRDREAAVRICPVSELSDVPRRDQYHFEFRAADAAASPYLLLAALIHAGAQGIEDALEVPEATEEDLSLLEPSELRSRGLQRLPSSLDEALNLFADDPRVTGWFPPGFAEVYVKHKQGELAMVRDLDDAARCRAYGEVY